MQVEERCIGLAADDDQVQAPLVLDVVVAEHGAVGAEDAKDVGLSSARGERRPLLSKPVAVLLEREPGRSRLAVGAFAGGVRLLAQRAVLEVDRVPCGQRNEKDADEAGDEERDSRHAAS